MQDCKGVKIPMPTNGHLCTDENCIDFDQKVYRSMIGSLLYLCASRPDIMLSVCMCARFQATPKESHHKAVKHILRYLAHTPTLGLWYPKGSAFDLIGYSDSDYAGDRVDRKSTSGTCHFLGRSVVCWLIRPFCIMLLYRYLLHYGLLLHIMSQYLSLFSLILQGLHEEGECRQLEFWTGKGANIRDLFCIAPKVLKLHGGSFWN